MEITKCQYSIKELVEDYKDNKENGVFALGGKLNVRPEYQREFVYSDRQRDLVIDSIIKGYPISIMYWNTKNDGNYEIIDGQQRTVSICDYVAKKFSMTMAGKDMFFTSLPKNVQQKILEYKIDVYKCVGTEEERKAWFEVINVAGETLSDQEILNSIYAGAWTTAAKKKFSKTGCPAFEIAKIFMPPDKKPIRQHYLETAIKWFNDGKVANYMDAHKNDTDANELWLYWVSVFAWVKATFLDGETGYRKEMRHVPWGALYNKYGGDKTINSLEIRDLVDKLMADPMVESKRGIYQYVFDGNEKHLSLRKIDEAIARTVYEKQKGICNNKKDCILGGERCEFGDMEADHITPWSRGGKSDMANCQMLCMDCNRKKGSV